MSRPKSKRFCLFVFAFWMAICWSTGEVTAPVAAQEQAPDKEPNILVVFSSADGQLNEHHRTLDMLLGHFSPNIRFMHTKQVDKTQLEWSDVLFYYGQQREFVPPVFVDMLQRYDKPVMAIGHNIEQLGSRFAFVEPVSSRAVIDRIAFTGSPVKSYTFVPQYVLQVHINEEHTNTETLISGSQRDARYPLLIRHGRDYVFASNQLQHPFSIAFAEGLHDVFQSWGYPEHPHQRQGYIRLEDIHPMVDPDAFKAVTDILHEKNIPYMVAVIPVYTNPETGEQHHFSDSPKLLNILKDIQNRGASIILHGYTHQFRLSETGEGFEFWDVEYNMPIYHAPDEEFVMKSREEFASDAEYAQYMEQLRQFERTYIEQRLTRGIQELANYGLYPLAFEAPHYTMSQHGYEIVSRFFTTYSGQLQLSDEDWQKMTAVPYITRPTFLKGMTLLPETIGYVDPADPEAIAQMTEKARENMLVRDGLVAGFYHPYLGTEPFLQLLEELEPLSIEWIDLKQRDNHVRTEHVEIRTENGQLIVHVDKIGMFLESLDYFFYHLRRFVEKLVWVVAGIAFIAVIMFIANIFSIHFHSKRWERGERVG